MKFGPFTIDSSDSESGKNRRTRIVGGIAVLSVMIMLGGLGAWLAIARTAADSFLTPIDTAKESLVSEDEKNNVSALRHMPLPEEVRGLYFTSQTAGSSERRNQLLSSMEKTGLNAVVIDLKTDNGELAFLPRDPSLQIYAHETPVIEDIDAMLALLADRGIYRIARIPVMRDGAFARNHPETALRRSGGSLWRDKVGSLWIDPAADAVADYAIILAAEAYGRGFDEIQFDYVRFASDGATSAIIYPFFEASEEKTDVMRKFFERVGSALRKEGIPVSFDLFGITFWSADDYNIGQRLIDAFPFADFVSPMVYPSHYPRNFEGYRNPAEYPYEIVSKTLEQGILMVETELGINPEKTRPKIRPWLQDFDIGAVYDASKIEAQIKAVRDAGGSGWMLWNARNVYEPARYMP